MGSILVGQAGVAILCFAVTDSTEFRKIDSTSFGRHVVTQVIKPKLILGARSAQEISGTSFTTPTTTKCLLRESADGILIIANLSRAAPADQAIYGEWSGATHHESREAGEVEKTHFVAWRSKLRSCRGYGHELDRAKTVRQVHRQQGYQQDSRHGEAGNRHKRARKDSKAPAQFIQDAPEPGARSLWEQLSPEPNQVNLERLDLKRFYSLAIPKSFIYCRQDKALPPGNFHPRMSSRLGKFKLLEMDGSHEVMFTRTEELADKVIEASFD